MFKSRFKFRFNFPKPNTNSYKILVGICSVVVTVFSVYLFVWAGNIDSPAIPSNDTGRMYTLKNIYDYLNSVDSAVPSKPSGGFTEPSAGPAGTMYTTDSIFTKLVRFPATGQTTTYSANDDGTYQSGATLLYADNGDGTITDSNTKLMWIKQPELIIPGASVIASNQIQVAHGNWVTSHAYAVGDLVSSAGGDAAPFYVCIVAHTSGTFATDLAAGKWVLTIWTATAANLTTPQSMVWSSDWGGPPDAISACENLTYAGHTDWRLPNVKELQSIVNYQNVGPAINTASFPNAQSDYYWSSTTYAGYSGYAWDVHFGDGGVDDDNKSSPYQVRCVR